MELEEAIKECKRIIFEYGCIREDEDGRKKDLQVLQVVLNSLTKQEKMIENVKDRIEYYLMGNSTLNDFNVREKELEKLLKILNKAEESV